MSAVQLEAEAGGWFGGGNGNGAGGGSGFTLTSTSTLPVGFFPAHTNYFLDEPVNVQFGHPDFVPNPTINGNGHIRISFIPSVTKELLLIGSETITMGQGSNFTDPGVILMRDGEDIIPSVPITVTGTVNTNIIGTYTITYSYTSTETSGTYTITRTVNVINVSQAFNTPGSIQQFTVPVTGLYHVQAWGASGGGNQHLAVVNRKRRILRRTCLS